MVKIELLYQESALDNIQLTGTVEGEGRIGP